MRYMANQHVCLQFMVRKTMVAFMDWKTFQVDHHRITWHFLERGTLTVKVPQAQLLGEFICVHDIVGVLVPFCCGHVDFVWILKTSAR